MPIGAKAATVLLGDVLGSSAFVAANYMNFYVQKFQNISMISSNDPPFSANSIIEQGDTVNDIMYFFNCNFIVSVIILSLSLLLIYLSYNKKGYKLVYLIWITLTLMTILSIYLAYNLYEDIEIIMSVYVSTLDNIEIINYNLNNAELLITYEFLVANMLFSIKHYLVYG